MKRALSILITIALLVQWWGCSVKTVRRVDTPELADPAAETIVGVTTKTGDEVTFRPPGAVVRDGTLHAKVSNRDYEIAIENVERFWIERKQHSTLRTIGLVAAVAAGTIAATAIVIAAVKESCPFVYSWDGHRYVFDHRRGQGILSVRLLLGWSPLRV